MVHNLNSFIFRCWATKVTDLNLWYILSNSTFYSNFITCLCFLGTLVALHGLQCILSRLGYYIIYDENYTRTMRSLFPWYSFHWRDELLTWRWLESYVHFKLILGFPLGSDGEETTCNGGRPGFDPLARKSAWRRK